MSAFVTSNEITINIPPNGNFRDFAERIARIIDWDGRLTVKNSGFHFMIGISNDWWLDDRGFKPAQIIVSYRYGNKDFMAKLREVIIKLLNIEHLNQDVPEPPA